METNQGVTQQYAKVSGFYVLLEGFRDDPGTAIAEVLGAAAIFAFIFGLIFFNEIMLWIKEVLLG